MRILVTGGTGTIGSYLVRMLSREHDVLFTFLRNDDVAMELVYDYNTTGIRVDVTEPPTSHGMRVLYRSVADGGMDALINNAGINIPNNFGDIDYDQWRKVVDVNLNGVYNVTHVLRDFISFGGRVINIGSVSADIGGKVSSHYTASKAGLVGLTRNLALYFAPRQITCNLLSLGYIESDMASNAMSPAVKETIASIPLKRLGTVQDAYGAIEFLISDKASYITGQEIRVNGGLAW